MKKKEKSLIIIIIKEAEERGDRGKRKDYLMSLVDVLGLNTGVSPSQFTWLLHRALEDRARNIAFTCSEGILILNTGSNLFSSVLSSLH